MERSTPESSAGTVGPSASEGSAARRSPRVVPAGKWTSPPKAKVSVCPALLQSGSRAGGPGWRWGGLVMVAGPTVALPRRRGVAVATADHERQDQGQHDEADRPE